ncbi:MLO-like protein 6 isoform X2 [Rhododendron vialii]|uniref:MLO-like protein 6 isoform X2 n=1 Tax=Rhododendron vialii TaxID=182163 RepID=UPI00265EDD69|nr:MLO-like protein 6 isoform X2 [Rhododendron vialii]
MAGGSGGRSLEQTPTWAVAVVCFALVAVSIVIEYIIHLIGKWLRRKHKRALYEALEKVKSELMLLGFISLLLTVGQGPISTICISKSVGSTWHPCSKEHEAKLTKTYTETDDKEGEGRRKLLSAAVEGSFRRVLAAGSTDKCAEQGKVPFVSSDGIHQLHIFIFVLAVFHVLYCILTMALGRLKMRSWKAWERETRTAEYQFSHDPERFRFARETSFGRRHLSFWTKTPGLIWFICFFRQFVRSVPKVDYLTLRHGFITAHLAPQSHTRFDFQKYINRSLEEDFKVVVGISPPIWLFAVIFLLFNTHGWYSYYWLPFIPLIIILLVGTKLQVIISKMAIRIQQKGEVVKGVPVVQPGDDLFWFNRPRLILYLINFVLFQNAFQLAFFAWTWFEFGLTSCFHERLEDIIIRVSMGIIIQILCSYVTLPLYALVTQMGSTMKPTIFNERVAMALQNWHHTAKKHIKQNRQSGFTTTPMSSRPATPSHHLSPVHLLRHYRSEIDNSVQNTPRHSNFDVDHWGADTDGSPPPSHRHHHYGGSRGHGDESSSHRHQQVEMGRMEDIKSKEVPQLEPSSTRVAPLLQHEIDIGVPKDFSFDKRTST